ncbi:carbamoyltransferase HypF [bacterium]|nr:carbamoyltransferase HypF [bacterium]
MKAYKIQIRGIVQGVGFRPFVWRIAEREKVVGYVRNESYGVVIFVQGEAVSIDRFLDSLRDELPPAARIDDMKITSVNINEKLNDFHIVESRATDEIGLIPADLAVCRDCVDEMFNSSNRRYLYPFINCTNCGPRFTIIRNVPYDRPMTTMSEFDMCDECRSEYENPANRRYHAQPISCYNCGPAYFLWERNNNKYPFSLRNHSATSIADMQNNIKRVAQIISSGGIVAVHGIGGFHLICDASNDKAVSRLRRWKNRQTKPFAVMAADIDIARTIAYIDDIEKQYLKSSSAPILLLKRRNNNIISELIAPGLAYIGIFLPYAPIHYLLFYYGAPAVIVATSGNKRDEPIAKDPEDAVKRLDIADVILFHNREIYNRADDSVAFVNGEKIYLIRRARGFIPCRYDVSGGNSLKILASGADMKGAIAVYNGKHIYPSQYIGEMSDPLAQNFWRETANNFLRWLRVEPDAVVCDLHPDYYSTRLAVEFANRRDIPVYKVQHHCAHAWSVIAEYNIKNPVIAVVFDGTGLGDDLETIWGGEFFYVKPEDMSCRRIGHIKKIVLPGGDAAAVKIYRMAYSYLIQAFGDDAKYVLKYLPMYKIISDFERNVLENIYSQSRHPMTTSAGRLFDAIASLIGLAFENEYEAYAPMKLEASAIIAYEKNSKEEVEPYQFTILENDEKIIDYSPMIRQIVNDVIAGNDVGIISLRFHKTVVEAIYKLVENMIVEYGTDTVVFSGGVFQNKLLMKLIYERFGDSLKKYFNEKNPSNDQGIALGQAFFAAKMRDV